MAAHVRRLEDAIKAQIQEIEAQMAEMEVFRTGLSALYERSAARRQELNNLLAENE